MRELREKSHDARQHGDVEADDNIQIVTLPQAVPAARKVTSEDTWNQAFEFNRCPGVPGADWGRMSQPWLSLLAISYTYAG